MQELFEHHEDIGTSARSEAYFSKTKQNLLPKGSAPKRVDKFLVEHCRSIRANLTKAYAVKDQLQYNPKPSRLMTMENLDHISTFENWRNQGTKPIQPESDDEFDEPENTKGKLN